MSWMVPGLAGRGGGPGHGSGGDPRVARWPLLHEDTGAGVSTWGTGRRRPHPGGPVPARPCPLRAACDRTPRTTRRCEQNFFAKSPTFPPVIHRACPQHKLHKARHSGAHGQCPATLSWQGRWLEGRAEAGCGAGPALPPGEAPARLPPGEEDPHRLLPVSQRLAADTRPYPHPPSWSWPPWPSSAWAPKGRAWPPRPCGTPGPPGPLPAGAASEPPSCIPCTDGPLSFGLVQISLIPCELKMTS